MWSAQLCIGTLPEGMSRRAMNAVSGKCRKLVKKVSTEKEAVKKIDKSPTFT
jgi:hypothetical protein